MESKICTYSEFKVRLQLVKVNQYYEIRFNRSLLKRGNDIEYLRLVFLNYINMICILRQSPLSIMTS